MSASIQIVHVPRDILRRTLLHRGWRRDVHRRHCQSPHGFGWSGRTDGGLLGGQPGQASECQVGAASPVQAPPRGVRIPRLLRQRSPEATFRLPGAAAPYRSARRASSSAVCGRSRMKFASPRPVDEFLVLPAIVVETTDAGSLAGKYPPGLPTVTQGSREQPDLARSEHVHRYRSIVPCSCPTEVLSRQSMRPSA